jgi:class 3 adenylate cyclase/pimeloyl-ACP methyl ester carboxylesterase
MAGMAPQVRYCTTEDGVRIAYAMSGSGYPLIRVLGWFSHLQLEDQSPLWRGINEALSGRFRYIRYDGRGTGLSDRHVKNVSLDTYVADLKAVIHATGIDRFALIGISQGGFTAVTYAAENPERVSHLVLYGTGARLRTKAEMGVATSVVGLIRQGWQSPAVRQFFTALFIPGAPLEENRWLTEFQQEMSSPQVAADAVEANFAIDVTETARRLAVPSLVLHRRGDAVVPFAMGRELASLIPDGQFQPLDGDNHLFLAGEPALRDFKAAVDEFVLGETSSKEPPSRTPLGPPASGTAVILFTDIADSTALTERMGDAAFRAASRSLDEVMRTVMRERGGTAVEGKLLGDGVLGVFTSAAQAIDAARRCVGLSAASELPLHIGLHAGDVIHESGNVYGGAVNIAARICGLCAPGEILVSQTVRDLARTSAGVTFDDRGEHNLKGITDPVRVFAIGPGG